MLRRKTKLGTKTCVLLDWNLKKLLSYLKSGPANLLKCKVSCKNKKHFEFGTRNDLFCYFQVRIWKNWYHILNHCSQIYQNTKCYVKENKRNFGIKIYLYKKKLEFKKTFVIFEYSTIYFENTKFHVKQKNLELGTKNGLFRYFQARIWKSYYLIWMQHFSICQKAKFHVKQETLGLRPKMHSFGTFRPKFGNTTGIFEITTLCKSSKFLVKGKKC